ncbi:peptidoglycan/xylan/chitin deacetylase (PgdA/CDA1 family) [Algoriphagus sp. 4150]|uniref:polysaccharide deacetylase family protein n=1 Tax=Algoriphagus sp. 4150 TaxID=2817756 RepID=UPI002854620C|nr:polysaccharide deacetylase family protein [Algoriphagus sp. 4150]MDR7132536.1 peptidoglycan/xylan/chitin deacetylase (PgdA/CDA1 family) [Algoriphagus sp. 4150]
MKKSIFILYAFSAIFASQAQILKKPIPDKLVVLTFDDAPASQYAVVAPLLDKYGFGATFFVCEFQPNYADSSLYMNWRQIQELDKMGFEIANHTHTHANVSKLTQEEFHEQLSYIEEKCDSLGIAKPGNFAYPGYGLNAQAIEFLQEKDYVFARAGGRRAYDPLSDYPYLIPSWATDETNKAEIIASFAQAKNGKIVVLTIHGVPDIEHPWVNTPPELFEEYLAYLSSNDFKVIPMRDLEDYIDAEKARRLITPDFDRKLSN